MKRHRSTMIEEKEMLTRQLSKITKQLEGIKLRLEEVKAEIDEDKRTNKFDYEYACEFITKAVMEIFDKNNYKVELEFGGSYVKDHYTAQLSMYDTIVATEEFELYETENYYLNFAGWLVQEAVLKLVELRFSINK